MVNFVSGAYNQPGTPAPLPAYNPNGILPDQYGTIAGTTRGTTDPYGTVAGAVSGATNPYGTVAGAVAGANDPYGTVSGAVGGANGLPPLPAGSNDQLQQWYGWAQQMMANGQGALIGSPPGGWGSFTNQPGGTQTPPTAPGQQTPPNPYTPHDNPYIDANGNIIQNPNSAGNLNGTYLGNQPPPGLLPPGGLPPGGLPPPNGGPPNIPGLPSPANPNPSPGLNPPTIPPPPGGIQPIPPVTPGGLGGISGGIPNTKGALTNYMDTPGYQLLFGKDANSRFQHSPGYQYAVDETMRGVQRNAASRGLLESGSVMREMTDRSQQMANQDYDKWWDRNAQQYGGYQDRLAALAAGPTGSQYAFNTGQLMSANANQMGSNIGSILGNLASSGMGGILSTGAAYTNNLLNAGYNSPGFYNNVQQPSVLGVSPWR